MAHKFEVASFSRFTYCQHCGKLIYGISKQGYRCIICLNSVHKKCEELVQFPCMTGTSLRSSQHSALDLRDVTTKASAIQDYTERFKVALKKRTQSAIIDELAEKDCFPLFLEEVVAKRIELFQRIDHSELSELKAFAGGAFGTVSPSSDLL